MSPTSLSTEYSRLKPILGSISKKMNMSYEFETAFPVENSGLRVIQLINENNV